MSDPFDDFVPVYEDMNLNELLRSALNAAGIDALSSTPDYELVNKLSETSAYRELERRVNFDQTEYEYDAGYCEQCNDYHDYDYD